MVNASTIPEWFIAVMMIYTGIMWLITRTEQIRMDSRIFALTFILQGLIYGILFQVFNVDYMVRGFFIRLILITLSVSQSLPLTISHFRSLKRGN